MLYPCILITTAFIFGAFAGSFLNVVIDRLPVALHQLYTKPQLMSERAPILKRLSFPYSFCDHCHHRLSVLDNIPILSYCYLRGHCRYCHKPINSRVLYIEVFCAIYASALILYLNCIQACFVFIFGLLLLALAIIDFKTHYLPDYLVYALFWMGLLQARCTDSALFLRIDSIILLFVSLYCIQFILGKAYLGDGDIKYSAAIGAWLSPFSIPLFLALTVIFGVGLFVYYKNKSLQPITKLTLPLGPALSCAGFISVFQNHLPLFH